MKLSVTVLFILAVATVGASEVVIDDVSEYRQLADLYKSLVTDPPALDKTAVQAVVAAVNGLVNSLPLDVTCHGVPHRVLGARMGLRIASVMAHRHSYCEDARTVALTARQAYVDWAVADPAKAALCTAAASSIDSQAAALQTQPDGEFPPPLPPPAPEGGTYEVCVSSLTGGPWGVSVVVDGVIEAQAAEAPSGWQVSFDRKTTCSLEIRLTHPDVEPEPMCTIAFVVKRNGTRVATANADDASPWNDTAVLSGSY